MSHSWFSAYSNNGTRNGGGHGGIPGAEPVWCIPVDERRFEPDAKSMSIMANLAMTSNEFYYLGDGCTVAMDLQKKSEIWRKPAVYRAIDGMALWDNYVFSGWIVHDRDSGDQVMDLRELICTEDPGRRQFTQVVPDGFLRYIEAGKNDLLVYNPISQEHRYLGIPVRRPVYHGTDNLIIGLRDNVLCAYNYSTAQLIWTKDMPLKDNGRLLGSVFSYTGLDGRTCIHVKEDVVECISNHDSATLWRSDEQLGQGSGTSYCSGMIDGSYYLMEEGTEHRSTAWFTAFDIMTGERQLAKHLDGTNKGFTINGDVMFVIFDGTRLAALDRFSGEQIWEASAPMAAVFECITAGNRVIYTSTVNEIRVYEWDKPYVSPHRWS